VLDVYDVTKAYGEQGQFQALKGVSLSVPQGEFVGIMGPSGAGKSTLLTLIATIDSPTSGEILVNGTNPATLNQEQIAQFRRRNLGFIFQDFNLLPTLTVEENIVLPLTLDGESVESMNAKAAEIGQRLGIYQLFGKRIGEISGGQAQRIATARAMIRRPELVLADEPTGNLDTKASRDVMELLSQINREEQATILMVTHDAFSASYCDRIIFISDGLLQKEIRRTGTRQEFFEQVMIELGELESE
jgi:putative ABC transport system ATP-binding protein